MKSEIIEITRQDENQIRVLDVTEKTAAACDLNRKSTLQLRLLAEEMMGLLRALTSEVKAKYWIEGENTSFQLHLTTETVVSKTKRRNLMAVSSSGKNMAAKGFIGTLRNIVDRVLESDEYDQMPIEYFYGLENPNQEQTQEKPREQEIFGENTGLVSWSMRQYLSGVESAKDNNAQESWDELEKSIVVRLADEVQIGIRGNRVEMVIYKKF